MSSTLHFPNAEIIKNYLSERPFLKINYFQEKGITKAIVDLAAERFADSEQTEMTVETGVRIMMNDLQKGKDGFTGKPLPDLGELKLNQIFWRQLLIGTQASLIRCAKQ